MKEIVLLVALFFATGVGSAQQSNHTQYAAYLKASKTLWEKSIREAENTYGKKSFEKAFAMYGLLNNTMTKRDEETFEDYVDDTVDLLKEIVNRDEDNGEPKAVLSSVYGLQMTYSPMKGMFLGKKSNSLMDDAMKQSPGSPLVQKLYAGSKLHTPKMWGGSPVKAETSFKKAATIFENTNTTDSWLYLDTLMGLSFAYQENGKSDKAIATLKRIIELEPNHFWAKSVLSKATE